MKTKAIFILAILVMMITVCYAKSPLTTMKETISSKIQFPKNAVENQIEGSVAVEFTVTGDGKVVVLKCLSSQSELQSYVFQTLNGTTVSPDMGIAGETYSMHFDFVLLK